MSKNRASSHQISAADLVRRGSPNDPNALRLSGEGFAGIEALLSSPLADAHATALSDRARRDALAVITSSYEEHGGFRLRTLSA